MVKIIWLFSFLLAFAGRAGFAIEIQVSVNGMVCGFCAQGIKKHFMAESAVDGVKVNLEKKLVTLSLREKQTLPDGKITEVLNDSGYAVEKIVRN